MILRIDTSNNKEVEVALTVHGKEEVMRMPSGQRNSQAVLPLLDILLQKQKKEVKDITAISVNQGPGSYTGLRVGIAIANTLGYLLHVPVNGLPPGESVDAIYS